MMEALAQHAGIAGRLKFEDFAETGKLRPYLNTIPKRPEYSRGAIRSILVTRDADDSYERAWQSVSDAMSAAFGLVLPTAGEWCDIPDGPRIAGWVNPKPGNPGMIETLCLEAARETTPDVFPCLDTFMDCIADAVGCPLHEKARFHLWTIVAQGPGAQDRLSLPVALKRMPPNWDSAAFAALTAVLKGATS